MVKSTTEISNRYKQINKRLINLTFVRKIIYVFTAIHVLSYFIFDFYKENLPVTFSVSIFLIFFSLEVYNWYLNKKLNKIVVLVSDYNTNNISKYKEKSS